jgi:molybdopterin molybdotransferase
LKKGASILGPEIAILASVGKSKVNVFNRPSVGIISTGNEIVEPNVPLEDGKIRNCNGPMLTSLTSAIGCNTEYFGIAKDKEKTLRESIKMGFNKDVLLLSGGVSMGDCDLVPEMLKKEGARLLFHNVLVKPGKPLLFAKKGKCIIFGVPGNPVSSYTSFIIFIKPALYKMMGKKQYNLKYVNAYISIDFESGSGRVNFVPSKYSLIDGNYHVTPHSLNGAADIISCSDSNCLMVIDKSIEKVKKGEKIKVILLDYL